MRHPRHFSVPFLFVSLPSSPPSRTTEEIPPTTLIQTQRYPSSTIRTRRRSRYPIRPVARLTAGKSSCKYARNCRLYLCKHPPSPRTRLWKLDRRIRCRESAYEKLFPLALRIFNLLRSEAAKGLFKSRRKLQNI